MKRLKPLRRRRDVLRAGDTAYVPSQLRHAYAVRRHPAEGAAEPDGPQVSQFDRGVHEGVCARCGRMTPGAVSDAGDGCGGHAERVCVSPLITA